MKHKDGIEIYLKPIRERGDEVRFPEFGLPDEDPLISRCCVPVIEQECEIVVKFSKRFDLFAANSIGVSFAYDSLSNGRRPLGWPIKKSLVAGLQYRYRYLSFNGPKAKVKLSLEAQTDEIVRSDGVAHDDYGFTEASPGTLLVCIRRCNFEWTYAYTISNLAVRWTWEANSRAEENRKILPNAAQSDLGPSSIYVARTGIHTFSSFIHDRQGDSIIEDVKGWRMLNGQFPKDGYLDNASALEFLPDLEFEAARKEATRIRDRWMNRKSVEASPPTKKGQKTTRICPPMCDCPAATRSQTRTKIKASTTQPRSRPREPGPGTGASDESNDSSQESAGENTSAAVDDITSDRAAESSANTCSKCEKLKKAPRGKKIAWRERRNKWMYVHKDAPDEEGPAEEQDDDEPLPRGESERKAATATTVETTEPPIANEQHQQLYNADSTHIANIGDDTVPVETDALDAGHATVARSSEEGASGTKEISDQQEVSSAAQENVEATKSMPLGGEAEATNGITQEQETHAEGPVITEASFLNAETQPQQDEPLVPGGAEVESRKRQNESENETPAAKKARIDIDLTGDDDDNLVQIKSENIDGTERRASAREDVENAEHDLEELQLQRRILEIELQEVKLRRKLAANRAQGGNKRKLNDGTVIKIED